MYEYEARNAPEYVQIMLHSRILDRDTWDSYAPQDRVVVFENLEGQFRLQLAEAATPHHVVGRISWRVVPDLEADRIGVAAGRVMLEVGAPVYTPGRPAPSFAAGPAQRSEADTQAVKDACDQIQSLAAQLLMKVGVHDILRVRLEEIVSALAKTFDLRPEARYWTFVKVPAVPTTEPADQLSRTAHLAKLDQLLAKAIQDATRPMSDHRAAEIAVRLLEHQAALLGLYPDGDS